MLKRRSLFLLLAGTALLAVGYACGLGVEQMSAPSGGGGAPVPTQSLLPAAQLPTQAALTALPFAFQLAPTAEPTSEPAPVAPLPAIPESRRLTLEYPPKIRAGDSDVIRLTLEIDTLGNLTPTAEVLGNLVTGQTVQIPNLYDTHNVIAEAQLDIAGPEVRPSEVISEPLAPGQSATFYWSVRPTEAGTYRGTVWFYLRFVDKLSGAESRKTVAAQPVQIEAVDFLGFDGNLARGAGGVGSVIGAVLGLPFVDEVLKWLWGRLRRRT